MSDAPPKTLIVGAHGLVGGALWRAYRQSHPDTIGTDWQRRAGFHVVDLAAPNLIGLPLVRERYAWAVIAAGVRRYSICEQDPASTRTRNVDGVLELSRQLNAAGIKIVYFSSDGVFDGEKGGYVEDSPVAPLNEYARQKVEVERRLLDLTGGDCLVLRISRVIGLKKGDGTLLDELAQSLIAGRSVKAARDQIFSTTLVDDIPSVVMALQSAGARGIFHVAGPESRSRFSIAQEMARCLGVDARLVNGIELKDVGADLRRPKNLSLDCSRLGRTISFSLTALSSCLERVCKNYQRSSTEVVHDQ